MIEEKQVHEKQVQDMQLSLDGTHVVTASTDRTSKLVDVQTLETLKTYNTERPANSAAISPIYDHVSTDPINAEGKPQPSLSHTRSPYTKHALGAFFHMFPFSGLFP